MNCEFCELCVRPNSREIWHDDMLYVIDASNHELPGYVRVVLNRHVKEMTDLTDDEKRHVMDVVFFIESTMRSYLKPEKVNLAEFGNMTPHLHWHIIARFADDAYFPEAIWAGKVRTPNLASLSRHHEDAEKFLKDLPNLLSQHFAS